MRTLRLEDYEKLARDIVADYMDNATPLCDGVAKTAESQGLNPDQTKNLVQLSNVIAHLKLFDKKTGDKNIEFEPADPDTVMKKIYADKPEEASKAIEKTEEGDSSDLSVFPDLMRMMQECVEPETEETPAEAPCPRRRGIMIIKIQKVAEELNNRAHEACIDYVDGIEKLAMGFRKLYGPDYPTFEKEGHSLFDARAKPVFKDLRQKLRLPEVEAVPIEIEKTACMVDSETPLMETLALTIKAAEEAQLCTDGVRFLDEKIGALL